MGDIDNAEPPGFELADNRKERFNLPWGKGSGRFVKYNHFALVGNRFHNFNDLFFCNTKRTDLCVRVQIIIHFRKDFPCLPVHLLPIDQAAFF